MKVNIADHIYEMTEEQAGKVLLSIAAKMPEHTIYAVQKGNLIICVKETYADEISFRKAIKDYEGKGFKPFRVNEIIHWGAAKSEKRGTTK